MPYRQRWIIEQAKSVCSPLGKAFKKQVETIDDRRKKIKETEDKRKQLGHNELLLPKKREIFHKIYKDESIKQMNYLKKKWLWWLEIYC